VSVAGRVAWILFTPVKGTMLRHADEAELLETGVRGDRRFYVVGETGRLVNDKDCGALQLVRAEYDEQEDRLALCFPHGREVIERLERGEDVATSFHGQPRPARLVVGPWADALSAFVGRELRFVEPERPAPDRGRSGAATLLGTSSLAALAGELGVDAVDGRRFRMNFGVDGLEPHAEDGWRGQQIRLGGAVVVPLGNVGRCAVTTQHPDTGRPDLDTLKALGRYRSGVETTEPLPFGVHAAVVQPGRVRVGDIVAPA
jgi:MOSC domain-containing protein